MRDKLIHLLYYRQLNKPDSTFEIIITRRQLKLLEIQCEKFPGELENRTFQGHRLIVVDNLPYVRENAEL